MKRVSPRRESTEAIHVVMRRIDAHEKPLLVLARNLHHCPKFPTSMLLRGKSDTPAMPPNGLDLTGTCSRHYRKKGWVVVQMLEHQHACGFSGSTSAQSRRIRANVLAGWTSKSPACRCSTGAVLTAGPAIRRIPVWATIRHRNSTLVATWRHIFVGGMAEFNRPCKARSGRMLTRHHLGSFNFSGRVSPAELDCRQSPNPPSSLTAPATLLGNLSLNLRRIFVSRLVQIDSARRSRVVGRLNSVQRLRWHFDSTCRKRMLCKHTVPRAIGLLLRSHGC
jgi:hypothetical protein